MAVDQFEDLRSFRIHDNSVEILMFDTPVTITFRTNFLAKIFSRFYQSIGHTLKPTQILSNDKSLGSLRAFVQKIQEINSVISQNGLMIINEYGAGYRLVEASDDVEKLNPRRTRTLYLSNGQQIEVVTNQDYFDLLSFFADEMFVTVADITNRFGWDPKMAMYNVSKLRKILKGTCVEIVTVLDGQKVAGYRLEAIEG